MFNVTLARINNTIIVIIKAIRVMAELDVETFDVKLFVYFCFDGSSRTPPPTTFNLNFSNVLMLFLFCFGQTEAFAPTESLKYSSLSLSYSCNGFSIFIHFTFLLLLFSLL